MMSAPSRASVMAWLRPWPRAAPVMKATLPSTRPVIVLSSLSWSVYCVQHEAVVLAGFRTKAGERVGVAGPGGGCRRAWRAGGGRAGAHGDRHRPDPPGTAWRGPGPDRAPGGGGGGRLRSRRAGVGPGYRGLA